MIKSILSHADPKQLLRILGALCDIAAIMVVMMHYLLVFAGSTATGCSSTMGA